MTHTKDRSLNLVEQVIQASFYARLITAGERVIRGESPYVAVFPPSDKERDAVLSCMQQQGLLPKTELSIASDQCAEGK